MDLPTDPSAIGGWMASGVIALGYAIERLKNHKKEKKTEAEIELVSDAKMYQARGDMLAKLAEDNLAMYIREHEQHEKTREYWHDKANEFQATLDKCQERLEEFQAKPDYSEIMEFIRQQAETSVKILLGIEKILKTIEHQVHGANIEVTRTEHR